MKFHELATFYQRLEATSGRLAMVDILQELYSACSATDAEIVSHLTLGQLAPDWLEVEFGMAAKLMLRSIASAAGYPVQRAEDLFNKRGDIGDVAQELMSKRRQKGLTAFTSPPAPLTVAELWDALHKLANTSGSGSAKHKHQQLVGLLGRIKPLEARYLCKIVGKQMRLGVRDITLIDGMTLARLDSKEEKSSVERASNLLGDIGQVARILWEQGIEAIKSVQPNPLIPIRNMAANRVSTVDELFEKLSENGSLEFKYDGIRVQLHSDGKEFAIFSRRLENMTHHFPELRKATQQAFKGEPFIAEAEVVAIDKEGRILPFQFVARRRRKTGIEQAMRDIPVRLHLFDLLYLGAETLMDRPFQERRETLEKQTTLSEIVQLTEQTSSSSPDHIAAFLNQAMKQGCEGLMGKKTGLGSEYKAGNRGWAWIKLKPDYESGDSFDLVIVGGSYGTGKRAGTYGTLLMACYDDVNQLFKTVTQLGSGFSDTDLQQLKEILDPLKLSRKPKDVSSDIEPDVWFEPLHVLQIVGTELSRSSQHSACRGFHKDDKNTGLAIRFPRILSKEFVDKSVDQATTEHELWEMFKIQNRKRSMT